VTRARAVGFVGAEIGRIDDGLVEVLDEPERRVGSVNGDVGVRGFRPLALAQEVDGEAWHGLVGARRDQPVPVDLNVAEVLLEHFLGSDHQRASAYRRGAEGLEWL
jgi:hypothetical protein